MADYPKTAAKRRMLRASHRIELILHGIPPEQQGLILAHLVALWLAGHFITDEYNKPQRPQTATLRDSLLEQHELIVREMLPEAESTVLARHGADALTDPIH